MRLLRTLHIYLSLLGLILMLFFAVTGFMMNHEDWFNLDQAQTRTQSGQLPTALLVSPDKLGIDEMLRADFGVRGALNSFDVDDEELRLVFKSPGRRSQAVISRSDGHLEVTHETRGLAARLTDLHKGADAPAAAKRLIDATAILLLIASLSGFVLWIALPRRRRLGLIALITSIGLCLAVYLVLIP